MKKAEIKSVISNYKPHVGFFDLSVQPQTLSEEEYAKILNLQNLLAAENKKFSDKRVRENNRSTWERLKILSGELQAIIFQNWNLDDLN
ncbi:hypothetical protein [Lacrimispora sp.]|uniref:hypothetical protein n=1 Tax=Lacrimispora sp. TaxID=2719234 RepID=UPI003995187F